MNGSLWFLIAIGTAALGLLMLIGVAASRRERQHPSETDRTEQATRELYKEEGRREG